MNPDNNILTHELVLALVQQSPDGSVFADREGVIRIWNDAATRVFGYPEEQAVGQSLDIIIPERFREAHWRGFNRALADRTTKYAGQALATRSARSDGTRIYVEMCFAIVLDANGEVLGVLSQVRDITQRFEDERASRKRLKELEDALAAQSSSTQ